MKKWIAFILLMIPLSAGATITGKLDLSMPTNGLLLRELHDGSWMGGLSKDIYQVAYNGNPVLNMGYAQVWRVLDGSGNGIPSSGLHVSIPTGSLGQHIEALNGVLSLPSIFKPLAMVGNFVGLDAMIGYSAVHTKDQHDFFYGVGAKVTIPVSDLLSWIGKGI